MKFQVKEMKEKTAVDDYSNQIKNLAERMNETFKEINSRNKKIYIESRFWFALVLVGMALQVLAEVMYL